jgi:hypothetical protein|tara:strand:+ start:2164 stop:2331 length:168 start_codon:yes stop_codon:yes gene_type:complete
VVFGDFVVNQLGVVCFLVRDHPPIVGSHEQGIFDHEGDENSGEVALRGILSPAQS